MLFKSVKGSLSGQSPDVINLVETTWKTWKEMFPDTKVVSIQTVHNRNYNNYPFGLSISLMDQLAWLFASFSFIPWWRD